MVKTPRWAIHPNKGGYLRLLMSIKTRMTPLTQYEYWPEQLIIFIMKGCDIARKESHTKIDEIYGRTARGRQ